MIFIENLNLITFVVACTYLYVLRLALSSAESCGLGYRHAYAAAGLGGRRTGALWPNAASLHAPILLPLQRTGRSTRKLGAFLVIVAE